MATISHGANNCNTDYETLTLYMDPSLILSSLAIGNSKMLYSYACRIPKSFQRYPDQSDQLSGA